jgi:quaternary ammonium compound-resistance protein SugE
MKFLGRPELNGSGRAFLEVHMNWFYLGIAGLLEIAWAIGLKYTDGWSKLLPSLATGALMIASFYFLSLAIKSLPIGTAYAVWTGIGTVGAAILGMILFDEPRDLVRIACIFLIIAGIGGLKLTSS